MEGRKPLNLEGLSSAMKAAEGVSPDLEIVRPDRNQGCTSSSSYYSPPPSPPPYVEKVPLSCLSTFEIEDQIKKYLKHQAELSFKDGGAKILHRLRALKTERERRNSEAQAGIDVVANANTHTVPYPKVNRRKQDVFDLEVRPSNFDQQGLRPVVDLDYPTVGYKSDSEGIQSLAKSRRESVLDVYDLEKGPCNGITKVCSKCHQSVSPSSEEAAENFCCASCKKNRTPPPFNGVMPVNSPKQNVCSISRARKSQGSAGKRSQQAVGDTYDTALELSDDEVLGEVVIGESSNGSCMSLHKQRVDSASKKLAGAKFLYPSSDDPEAVEVKVADLQHLAPSEFLNDTVIDFYIKYMQMNVFEEKKESLHRFHFFSCFFYKKLTFAKKTRGKDWFEEVHKWTKGIDLFNKSYLFVPIHDSCHWSLAIICFLADRKTSYILHLDSMSSAGHQSIAIFNVLKSYLLAERKYLIRENYSVDDIPMIDPSKATCKRLQVPLQENEWDCGLFMLYYIQKFVTEVDLKSWDEGFGHNWFKPSEASDLRATLFTILESIFTQDAATSS